MTGHQGHPATGVSATGKNTCAVNLEALCRGIGVEDVNVVSAFDLEALESTLRRCMASDKPSVVIARGPCSLHVRARGTPLKVDPDECVSCYDCMDLGCPAIIPADGKVEIDAGVCVGTACAVCTQVCPQQAISEAGE
jgi:indolepyruvate ferredoxin oxidoreductase alpha subunit